MLTCAAWQAGVQQLPVLQLTNQQEPLKPKRNDNVRQASALVGKVVRGQLSLLWQALAGSADDVVIAC